MVFSSRAFAFLLAVAPCVLALNLSEINLKKHLIIRRESLLAANAIRNISTEDPRSNVQLASMANDFVLALSHGVYYINNAIPSTLTERERNVLVAVAKTLCDFAKEIQESVSGTSVQLKERLAQTLEKLNQEISRYDNEVHYEFDELANIQHSREHDSTILGINKLKYRAIFFKKSNTELISEMYTSLTQLTETLNSITATDKLVEEELRRILQFAALTASSDAYKLENWNEVNSKKSDDVKVLEEVSHSISEISEQLNRAGKRNHNLQHMRAKLINIYKNETDLAKKMAVVEGLGNIGSQEFIRSTLFNLVTFGRTYANNFKDILALH